jgi:hypothetical protein
MTGAKMRLPEIAMLVTGMALVAACGDPPCAHDDEHEGGAVYALELRDDSPDDTAYPMMLANDTLVFPLALDKQTQLLTRSAPGDLIIAYTRVGCWIDDPETWVRDLPLRAVPPVYLTTITMDQVSVGADVEDEPRGLSESSCFTYRTCDGVWHPLLAPTTITAGGGMTTATLSLDVEGADAVAVFLPQYTHAWRVTYTAE